VAELLIVKGASRDIENDKGKTASSYGLDEALAEIQNEEEELRKKQEWIAEERSRFQSETAGRKSSEKEWREKLLDEHAFEHIEGAGYGTEQRAHFRVNDAWTNGWFAEDEDSLNDDDWWAAIARQMHRRHTAFTDTRPGSTHTKQEQHARPYQGIGKDAKMAWERKWAKEGSTNAASSSRSGVDAGGDRGGSSNSADSAARAALHAQAWERFIMAQVTAGDDAAIRFDDVPWPAVPPGGDLAEEAMMLPAALRGDADARRRAVREALRRWHPDKFGQRFGSRLAAADRDRILERVKAVSQALTALVQ
jgi:hypothetical protein